MPLTLRALIVRAALVFAAATFAVFGAGSAEARNRPTISSYSDCWADLSSTKGYIYGTSYSMCCYDDGCYVCYDHGGAVGISCEWVPKAVYGVLPPGINPPVADPGANPQPPFGQAAPGIKPPL
jgi:hypothetical protein